MTGRQIILNQGLEVNMQNTFHLMPHLYYFLTVSKHKSFSKAAQEMHISPSAISYQIKTLEDKVGKMLLNRNSGQRSELTTDGKYLADQCTGIITHLNESLDTFIHGARSRQFKITAPITFGNYHLLPALEMLNEHLQKNSYTVILTDDIMDIQGDNIDLAIRNVPTSGEIECEKLMYVTYHAIASCEYLEKNSRINSPYDLKNHTLIDSELQRNDWARVAAAYPDAILPPIESRHSVSRISNNCFLSAVKNHRGIALVPSYLVKNLNLKKLGIRVVLADYINEKSTETLDILYASYPKLNIRKPEIVKIIMLLKKYLKSEGESLFD